MRGPETDPAEENLRTTLWAIGGLSPGDLFARVVGPNGDVLQAGQWIDRPEGMSACRAQDWYRDTYGDLAAIDLNWRDPFGATSVWPITGVTVHGNAVVITGPRGTLTLTWPPRDGCSYADVMWSAERAARQTPRRSG